MLACERHCHLARYVHSLLLAKHRSIQLDHLFIDKELVNFHHLLPAVQACTALGDLPLGQKLALSADLNNVFVASSFVTLFSRCSRMDLAQVTFDRMPVRDVVAWNALLYGYAANGDPEVALDLFSRMADKLKPDAGTFVAAIKACCSGVVSGSSKFFDQGRVLHFQAEQAGYLANFFVANSIIDFYCKAGKLAEAHSVFDAMPRRSASSWNTLVLGYAEQGSFSAAKMAVKLFHRCSAADSRGFVAVIKACSMLALGGQELEAIEIGKLAEETGFRRDKFVANSLIDLYAKCGFMDMSRRIFEAMLERDSVSWTSLLLGYVDNNQEELAIDLFRHCESPNELTFVAALKACSRLSSRGNGSVDEARLKMDALEQAMKINARAWRSGYGAHTVVATTTIDVYSKCGSLLDARIAFDRMELHTTASWNAMMLGYVDLSEAGLALEIFACLRDDGAVDSRSFIAAIRACGELRMLDRGIEIHSRAKELGLDSDSFLASALVEMYVRCSGGMAEQAHIAGGDALAQARKVCDNLPLEEIVPWTSLMLGYVESGQAEAALEIFARLRLQRAPDPQLFLAALSACGSAASLAATRAIHSDICRSGSESYKTLANSMIDVYGKCGDVIAAHTVFDSSRCTGDRTAWTVLLAAYSRGGDSTRVLGLFQEMVAERVAPDGVTLLCVLGACSHAGLVDSGKRCFDSMTSEFGIKPGDEHYVCMVDMLGRANRIGLAVELVKSMRQPPGVLIWRTLLAACAKWSNVEVGKIAFDSLVELDPEQGVAYVLMGNILKLAKKI